MSGHFVNPKANSRSNSQSVKLFLKLSKGLNGLIISVLQVGDR